MIDDKRAMPIFWLGVIACASYLATIFVEAPVAIEAPWKASGIVLFAVFALLRGAPIAGAALLASAAGDVALALRPPVFEAGMAFFGLAHLLYIAAFVSRIRKGGADKSLAVSAVLVVAASAALGAWFLPDMGTLTAPGLTYQTIITIMVATALISPAPMLARLGALVFMISDTLIALGLYKHIAVPPGSVWIAYAAGQAMLAYALSSKK